MFKRLILIAFIAFGAGPAWAAGNQYVSGLAAIGSVSDSDLFYDCPLGVCNAGSIGVSASASQIATYLGAKSMTFTNKTYSSGVMSGTFSGSFTLSGTPTFSGTPIFSALGAGTCSSALSLDAGNHMVTSSCSGGGSGLNQLTGAVTAGPGTGSQVATITATGVAAGSYTNTNITVNAAGQITSATNGGGSPGYTLTVSTLSAVGSLGQ